MYLNSNRDIEDLRISGRTRAGAGVEGLTNGSIKSMQNDLSGKNAAKQIAISTSLGIARGFVVGAMYAENKSGFDIRVKTKTTVFLGPVPYEIHSDNIFHVPLTDFSNFASSYFFTETLDFWWATGQL